MLINPITNITIHKSLNNSFKINPYLCKNNTDGCNDSGNWYAILVNVDSSLIRL